MDYHADRFSDCSLIACRKGAPTALLPANLTPDGTLYSHQGLTYGGWLTPRSHFDGSDMLDLFDIWLEWCKRLGISRIIYKPVPHIYHRIPAEEDIYALFRAGAQLQTVNLSSSIDMRDNPGFNTLQRRHLKKSAALTPWIRETEVAKELIDMVAECLKDRHNATPLHSADELQRLRDSFPANIRFFLCGTGAQPEAAVCIYDTAGVAHCQYIATTEEGRRNGTLTYLMHHLISDTFSSRRWIDFGTSNEDAGRYLNSGLIHQKTGLGARGIAYPTYRIQF